MNSELRKLHQQLIKTHTNLARRLGTTRDPGEAEEILREMEEVNFRVMMAGRLLFSETTAAIDKQIGTVIEAGADLDEAIKEIEAAKKLIKAVGKFLTQVDKLLDGLKLI